MKDPTNGARWHFDSMMKLYEVYLPELLQQKLPLSGYESQHSDSLHIDIRVSIDAESGPISITFEGMPVPDVSGVFHFDDRLL